MPSQHLPIFLLTDFGLADPFVGTMKGVMLRAGHRGPLVDLTHGVPPHAVQAGAMALEDALPHLPLACVVLAVVDPGVGTARAPIAVRAADRICVGPDNGLLTPALDATGAEARSLLHADGTSAFPRDHPLSATFHGRDLFAPAAAWLAVEPTRFDTLKPPCTPIRLATAVPQRLADGTWEITLLAADHFGNVATNYRPTEGVGIAGIRLEDGLVIPYCRTYGDVNPGAPLCYLASSGRLEIALREGNALRELGLRPGQGARLLPA